MESLTELLDRVDAYCEKATDGEWSVVDNRVDMVDAIAHRTNWENDAAFIAAARTDLPRLSAALREMMGENERLRGLVYLPKILDDDEQVTFADHSASLLRRHDSLRARVIELEDELGRVLADLNQVEADRAALAATEK